MISTRGQLLRISGNDMPQNLRDLLTRRPLSRTQQRQHGFAGACLEDMHGLEAVAARMGVEENEFLLAMRQIVRVVDVQHDAPGTREKLAQNRSIIPSAMRASECQDGAFSRRDSVGWDMRSLPVSGRRPHAILKAGSMRSASRSSQSS